MYYFHNWSDQKIKMKITLSNESNFQAQKLPRGTHIFYSSYDISYASGFPHLSFLVEHIEKKLKKIEEKRERDKRLRHGFYYRCVIGHATYPKPIILIVRENHRLPQTIAFEAIQGLLLLLLLVSNAITKVSSECF